VRAPLRVGIAGARGIGRHQAKWFAQVGCEVAAIYGTGPETASAAAQYVRQLCDFQGRVECDWDQFVSAPDLDAISVCSPPEAHYANVLTALRAGKHVLCEKPFVWDWQAGPDRMREASRVMVETAVSCGRVLALNAQYPAAVEPLLQLYREAHGRAPLLQTLLIRMETAGPPRSPHGPAEVWADLGPHPLAVVDALLPGGAPDVESSRREPHATDVLLQLDWVWAGKRAAVSFELRRIEDRAAVRREFVLDGWTAAYQGRNVGGEFQAALTTPCQDWAGEDFMRTSVRRFAAAAQTARPDQCLVSGEAALRQFEIQIALWEQCFR
jgi:hypothetical protein